MATTRGLPPRSVAFASLLVSAIGIVAVVALLTAREHNGRQTSAPVSIAHSAQGACAPGTTSARTSRVASAIRTRRSGLDDVLDAALRAARARTHAPAVTGAVVVCGRVVWADATGVLDLGSKGPATNRTLFVLNSAVKTYVATMVMMEIQDGHLALGTRLSQFYPWLPNARRISIRMLLNMTSGLPDYLNNARIEWTVNHEPRHHWTVDQVLTGLGTGLGTPKFSPGQEYQYSDTNYIVLGAILERLTHRSIQSDFQTLIARRVGVTSATFVPTPAAQALVAHPYLRDRDGSLVSQWIPGYGVSSAVWGPVFTDGGLASSSIDVARFGNALIGGRLLGATALTQMTHIGRGDYGFGIRDRVFDGHYWLGHRGYFGGFEAEVWTDPARQVTIAVGTNLEVVGGGPISTPIWTAVTQAYDRQSRGTDRRSSAGAP